MTNSEILSEAAERLSSWAEEVRYAAVKEMTAARTQEAIPILIRAFGDSSCRVREEAINGVCSFPPEVVFPSLDSLLRNGKDAGLRNAAIEAFPRYGRNSVEFLCNLLDDPDEEVRMFSATILGEIEHPDSVEALIMTLDDPDENVRHAAAESLGRIRDARAVKKLIDCLAEDFWVQYPAVVALGNIGDPAAIPSLAGVLDNEMLKPAAIEALGKIGDESVIPLLTDILYQGDMGIRNDTIAALVSIQSRVEKYIGPSEDCLHSIKESLENNELIEHLMKNLQSPDLETRKISVIALGWLRENRAAGKLVELLEDYELEEYVSGSLVSIGENALPELTEHLKNPDPMTRASIVRCIGWIGNVDAIKSCLPFLKSDSPELRYQTVTTMGGALELEEVEEGLLFLLSDPDPELQGILVETLGRSQQGRLFEKLLKMLSSKVERKKNLAVRVLGRIKNQRAYEPLIDLLGDNSENIRAEAYKALREICGSRLSENIIMRGLRDKSPLVRKEVYRCVSSEHSLEIKNSLLFAIKDPDPEARLAAIEALGRRVDASLGDYLITEFEDCDPKQRLAIVRVLGDLGNKNSLDFLTGLLKKTTPDLKRAALESLGKIKERRSVPDLIVALDDSEWSVRIAAINALVEIGDHRCSIHLLEKLSDPEDIIKKEAIIALGRLGSKDAVNYILPLINNENLQMEVLSVLEKLGIDDLDLFMKIFRQSNTRLKCLLVDLLGRTGNEGAADLLMSLFEEEFLNVRIRAARALGELKIPRAIPVLLKVRKNDPSNEVRKEAALALKKLDSVK